MTESVASYCIMMWNYWSSQWDEMSPPSGDRVSSTSCCQRSSVLCWGLAAFLFLLFVTLQNKTVFSCLGISDNNWPKTEIHCNFLFFSKLYWLARHLRVNPWRPIAARSWRSAALTGWRRDQAASQLLVMFSSPPASRHQRLWCLLMEPSGEEYKEINDCCSSRRQTETKQTTQPKTDVF